MTGKLEFLIDDALAMEGTQAICDYLSRETARCDLCDFAEVACGCGLAGAHFAQALRAERKSQASVHAHGLRCRSELHAVGCVFCAQHRR